MSLDLMKATWELRDLKPNMKFVLLCLADFSGPAGTCWPSMTTISEKTGLSRSTVKSALKQLEAGGFLQKTVRFAKEGKARRKTSNFYKLNLLTMKSDGAVENPTLGSDLPHGGAGADHKPNTEPKIRTICLKEEVEDSLKESIYEAFDSFWNAGLIKRNRKKALGIFRKIVITSCKRDAEIRAFGQMLAQDIERRIKGGQFGIEKLHPTTYLTQERWEDEYEKCQSGSRVTNQQLNQLCSKDRFLLDQLQRYGERTLLETGMVSEYDVERLSSHLEIRERSSSRVVEGHFTVLNE